MASAEQPLRPAYASALRQVESGQKSLVVVLALSALREQLGMDVSYVTTVASEHQTVDALIGDPSQIKVSTGTALPIEQTYCRRMLDGKMPNAVPDTRAEPAVRDLAATDNIGAYIGVPVTFSDRQIHGTLCAASRDPRPDLGEDETRFVKSLAALIASRLEQLHTESERRQAPELSS